MRVFRNTITAILCFVLSLFSITTFGQLGTTLDLQKPKEYEERVLRSERDDKKFTLPRRFMQNTVTHYNYFFNANNKINEIIQRAKDAYKDDYSQLLPFYNYSLDVTAADSLQLDSVSYKSQTGIALHDLRNDWIDNMYILWGQAYYFRKQFDSAYLMFQYINFAFAEKEKDGYYKTIGSSRDGNAAFSISTKEKNSLTRRAFSEPPSRNDAFIWQIRNFLAQDQYAEAASLIVTLRDDPVFPSRLKNDLEEVQAYWFYKQNMWDSAATHLELALGNAGTKQEKARWEYLLAQLHELAGNYKQAENFYARASNHTTDLIMDVYARLFSVKVNKDGGENYIEKNIEDLLKMAKRDKYSDYRDIIYYMAAQMQLERNNIEGAIPLLLKSTSYSSNNLEQRNKAFLQLGELAFSKKLYKKASSFYDSIRLDDPSLKNVADIEARKEVLARIAWNIDIIERQDSVQRIAAMPEQERQDFVKKIVKQLRKEQGLKDEGMTTGRTTIPQSAPALFGNNESKGEWYFYNATSRQKGATDFKSRWGNRPNVDNWRRSASISAAAQAPNPNMPIPPGGQPLKAMGGKDVPVTTEITYDALYGRLPLTPELMTESNDSLQAAMFALGKSYAQEIEDCESGIETLEKLRTRFPQFNPMDEVLFTLYYCYNKSGNANAAAAIKKLMGEKYGQSNFTTIVATGKNPQSKEPSDEATKTYEKIYDLFIEGRFDEAVAEKKIADQKFGKNYWTPQLLYIEAVYYIRQREDSTAIGILRNINNFFPGTPLAIKATNLAKVLGRRKQIEEELQNMVVNRPAEETRQPVTYVPAVPTPQPPTNVPVKKDTISSAKPIQPNVVATKPAVDTLAVNKPAVSAPTYRFDAAAPHFVVILLNKVDKVFVNEARNAFDRYNKDIYYNKQYNVELIEIDADNRLVLISPFKNSQEAIDYIDKTKPKTASEILPWLKGGKYAYSAISPANLEVLKTNKDIETYTQFINQYFPGKF